MKIAIVHYTCEPIVGGVERVIAGHAAVLARNGHGVTLACLRGDCTTRLDDLDTLCAAHDVVIVHNVMTMPFDLPLTLALAELTAAFPKVRFIAWTHDVAACNPDLAPVPPVIGRAFGGFEYVAVSELRRRQLRDALGVDAPVIPNGLGPAAVLGLTENVARLAGDASLLEGRIVLLHPTRMLHRKNVECGIRAIAALKKDGHPATLVVTAAEDPHNPVSAHYAMDLIDLRRELDVKDEVVFAGGRFDVTEADVAALYRIADALFFPSRSEGFGLPVLEAALHGLPIFCSDIEPLRAIAPRHAHFFKPEAPGKSLATLIRRTLTKDERSAARRHILRESTWDAVYARHIAPLLRAE